MHEKELLVGVDEFSLVLFPKIPVESEEWSKSVLILINEFIDYSKIEILLGKVVVMNDRKPSAYSQAFTIENAPYYFAIAYHEHSQNMGILVRFSAYAWALYQRSYLEYYGKNVNIALFLKMIDSVLYDYRLSRIDITADYKNYDSLSPNYIYNLLQEKIICVEDYKGRVSRRKISAVQNDMKTETFYVGSRKENSKLLLRVYDKKKEQTINNGFRLKEAINCDNWTRFEVSYRGDYAHQITQQLCDEVENKTELTQFLADKICDKFRFAYTTGGYTYFTKDLLLLIEKKDFSALRTENPDNNNLTKSISHIIKGSGLYPLLFKIGAIWNKDTEIKFFEIIYKIYIEYYREEISKDYSIINWIKKNYESLSKKTLKSCFIGEEFNDYDMDKLVKSKPIFNLRKISENEYNDTDIISDEEFDRLMSM